MASSVASDEKALIILGIRGVPGNHGGFETFAERLCLYLRDRGWRVTVYQQGSSSGRRFEDTWEGIRRIHIPVSVDGALATVEFDAKCAIDVLRRKGTILTLGYNTGFLSVLIRLAGRKNVINMDGIEWKRAKYSRPVKIYLWLNERLAAWSGTQLIADHPKIAEHVARMVPAAKVTMIPYGGDEVVAPDASLLDGLGLAPGGYLTVIARPEPENSILEIVRGFLARPRDVKLVILGNYLPSHPYQAKVLEAAGAGVVFPGAIYDKAILGALRAYSLAYIHGHQVGGTNPSLVEALAAGNAVIAHDNPFNRWVAGDAGIYFSDSGSVGAAIEVMTGDPGRAEHMRAAARRRFADQFTWDSINSRYEAALLGAAPESVNRPLALNGNA